MLPLLFAWLAFRPSRRPADTARAYGYHRSPVLAAFTNDISLVFICIWIFGEAADRLYPLNRGWAAGAAQRLVPGEGRSACPA